MADVPHIQQNLKEVWQALRKAGVTDEVTAVEHVAALLVERKGLIIPEPLRPRKVEHVEFDLAEALGKAVAAAGEEAQLFDPHVLLHLPSRILTGGRYPTPRHLIEHVVRLADVRPDHHVADLACGTGGFLVRRPIDQENATGETVGVEIAPQWARLAHVNVALHDVPNTEVRHENALRAFHPETGSLREQEYDRIVFNPPFGETVDAKLLEAFAGDLPGTRSETVLTMLALKVLAPGGKAAVLIPSGVLFSDSTGEYALRRKLVDDFCLHAVITLPKDALQPYSGQGKPTHLILAEHGDPAPRTWFFHTEQDGYPGGKGRDLSALPPTQTSDLPLVEDALMPRPDEASILHEEPVEGLKRVVIVRREETLIGFIVEASEETVITTLDWFPSETNGQPALLVSILSGEEDEVRTIEVNPDSEPKSEDRARWIEDRYPEPETAPEDQDQPMNPWRTVYRGEVPGVAVACSADGERRGQTIAHALLHDTYELRPDQYVKPEEDAGEELPPAELLVEIRGHQRKLSHRLDLLLGRLDFKPLADETLPPPLREDEYEPIGKLSPVQEAVWKCAREFTRIEDGIETARPFTLFEVRDVLTNRSEFEHVDAGVVQRTLDLMEAMGVVVRASVKDPKQTARTIPYYRLATERDIPSPQQAAPSTP